MGLEGKEDSLALEKVEQMAWVKNCPTPEQIATANDASGKVYYR